MFEICRFVGWLMIGFGLVGFCLCLGVFEDNVWVEDVCWIEVLFDMVYEVDFDWVF